MVTTVRCRESAIYHPYHMHDTFLREGLPFFLFVCGFSPLHMTMYNISPGTGTLQPFSRLCLSPTHKRGLHVKLQSDGTKFIIYVDWGKPRGGRKKREPRFSPPL